LKHKQEKADLHEESDRVCMMVNGQKAANQPEFHLEDKSAVLLFKELVKPRENLIRYSSMRTVLTSDPAFTLNELFQCYVDRQFADRMA